MTPMTWSAVAIDSRKSSGSRGAEAYPWAMRVNRRCGDAHVAIRSLKGAPELLEACVHTSLEYSTRSFRSLSRWSRRTWRAA